jgi:hypothetical protein
MSKEEKTLYIKIKDRNPSSKGNMIHDITKELLKIGILQIHTMD